MSLRADIREAIEAAASAGMAGGNVFKPSRPTSFSNMRAKLREFLRNCPEDMTVRDLLEEFDE